MLQPYLTPGGATGHPQQAYMIPHPGVQNQPMYQVPHQAYQQPQMTPYHIPAAMPAAMNLSQGPSTMLRSNAQMTGGPIHGAMAAPSQHLQGYSMQHPGTAQKSVYSSSWVGSSLVQPPPHPGQAPAAAYPAQGMNQKPWNVSPPTHASNSFPSQQMLLHSSFTSGVTQSYQQRSLESASTVSVNNNNNTRERTSYSSLHTPPRLSSPAQSSYQSPNISVDLHAAPRLASPAQSSYQSPNISVDLQTPPRLASPAQSSYQSPNISVDLHAAPRQSSPANSSYQYQNLSVDIKSTYARQRSESGSAASSRSSSPNRSRSDSIHSKSSLTTIEAKDERCTNSPPIAPHPFATGFNNDTQLSSNTVQVETEVDKIFQSRAFSHGIQISAPGTVPLPVKRKIPNKNYHEKVKADRFMEIALKRGIVVSMGEPDLPQKESDTSCSVSESASVAGDNSSISSIVGDTDAKSTGPEADSSDNIDCKSVYSDCCSQSDGEGYLSDFSSHFARVIIEDVCNELTHEHISGSADVCGEIVQELNSGLADQSSSKLNVQAKEFSMSWSSQQPVALNPESPEFKPGFFRQKEATPSTDEDSDSVSALFHRNCNSGVDIYIADQPEMDDKEDDDLYSAEPSDETGPVMVDVAVNTKRIKQKDADMQTPLAFEPRDVCVNTDEMCINEGSEFFMPEILLRTQATNTKQVETRSRFVQANIGVKTQNHGIQVGSADDFQEKQCKHCPEKDLQIVQLQMQLCHLRAQLCISELQRQMTELQQSKLQLSTFFTSTGDDDLEVANLIDARIEWLEDEISLTKVTLMKCVEELQKGQPLENLPPFGITISTPVGNTVLVPKELRFLKQEEKGAQESPRSRKRTHEKVYLAGQTQSPNKTLSMTQTVERISTRTLVEESLHELQRERKSGNISKAKHDRTESEQYPKGFPNDRPMQDSHLSEDVNLGKDSHNFDKDFPAISPKLVVETSQDTPCDVNKALKSAIDRSSIDIDFPTLSIQKAVMNTSRDSSHHGAKTLETAMDEYCSSSMSGSSSSETLAPTVQHMLKNHDNSGNCLPSEESSQERLESVHVENLQNPELVSTEEEESVKSQTRENDLRDLDATKFSQPESESEAKSDTAKLTADLTTMNLTDQVKDRAPKPSLPNPIPTLPYPYASNGSASKSSNTDSDSGVESNVPSASASSSFNTSLRRENLRTEKYPSDNSPLLRNVDGTNNATRKDPEEICLTPKKESETRAPPGFENSGSPLDDEIHDDIQDCDMDTDQLVKKARAVLENFNLSSHVVVKTQSTTVKIPMPASVHSPISGSEKGEEVAGTAVEVLTTGRSVAGTGEIKQIISKETSNTDTGISDLILSARKKLQESDAICEKMSKVPKSDTDSASVTSESSQNQVSVSSVSRPDEPNVNNMPSVPLFPSKSEENQKSTDQSEVQPPQTSLQPQQQTGQINSNLYQAVFTQVAKAYPHLVSNPMMLHSVCLQQTMVLQSYMRGSQGGGPAPVAPPAGFAPSGNQFQPSHQQLPSGAAVGQHVQSSVLQTGANLALSQNVQTGANLALSQNVLPAQTLGASSRESTGASWNPVALVNMMQARKGTGDLGQQTCDTDTTNLNAQTAFKFQAAAAPDPKPNAVVITGSVTDTGHVPSGLKDYLLKDKKTNALEISTAHEMLETKEIPSSDKESNPFEATGGTTKSLFTKITSQKKRSTTKTKPGISKSSPPLNTQKELFPTVKAIKVATDEDWDEDTDNYPKAFKCTQNVKAPVYFKPIEPSYDTEEFKTPNSSSSLQPTSTAEHDSGPKRGSYRGRRRNSSEKSQGSYCSTRSSTPSDEIQTMSGAISYTGLDDFGARREAKPSKPNTSFLGRLLKHAVNVNDKMQKEKEERVEKKTEDEKKTKKPEAAAEDDDWQTVSMKKRKRDQTRAEQLPSMAVVSASSKGDTQVSRNNFDKLVDHLAKIFPFLSRLEIKELIQTVRYQRGGGLTGMKMNDIVDAAKLVVQQKFQAKLISDSRYSLPGALVPENSSGSVYCTPEFQKHFEITSSALPQIRPTARSPGSSSNDEDVCPICFEDFTHDKKQKLDCGHEFHVSCIREWVLKHERTCPTCRRLTLFQEEFPRLK